METQLFGIPTSVLAVFSRRLCHTKPNRSLSVFLFDYLCTSRDQPGPEEGTSPGIGPLSESYTWDFGKSRANTLTVEIHVIPHHSRSVSTPPRPLE